jgi:DNA polymerase-3 subunit alpha
MKIENKNFVHLHVHSERSALDSLACIKKLVEKARKNGFQSLALTDHGNISGWIQFIQECRSTVDKNGDPLNYPTIKPILGMETYLCRKMEWQSKDKQPDLRRGNRHLILLAKNWEGYQNLCYLSNESFSRGFYFDPRIDIDILAANSTGIMVSSACLSSLINANLYYDRYDAARKAASIFKDIFKDDFFLEIMFHGINAQAKIIPDIIKLGKELDVPLIATNDLHYLEKDQALSQEVLACMNMSRCLKDPKHNHMPYDEFYLKSADEMMKIFKDIPQVVYNTLSVAERVDSEDINRNLFISGMRLPKIDIPVPFKSPQEYLEYLAWEGMRKIGWDKSEEHVKRLKIEIEDIKVAKENNNYDFATYFLIVRDYVNYANEKGVLVGPGRGSGFASILLRCLGITYGVDPLHYNLFWERFLGFCSSRFVAEKDFGFISELQTIPVSHFEENEENIDDDTDIES